MSNRLYSERTTGRRAPFFGMLSGVALSAGIALVVYFGVNGAPPKGDPLKRYDFSEPEEAMLSIREMILAGDSRALQAYSNLSRRREAFHFRDTARIQATHELGDRRYLFIVYRVHGVTHHKIEAYRREVDSGRWVPDHTGIYSMHEEAPLRKAAEAFTASERVARLNDE